MKKIIILITFFIFFLGCKNEQAKKYYQKAYELEERERYREAIKELDQAIDLHPTFEQAYLDRAIDKSIIGDFVGAIKDLDVLIELRPEGIDPYVHRAEYKRMLEKYESAIEDLEFALSLKKPIIVDRIIIGATEMNYDNAFIKNENFDTKLENILFERALSNFALGNYKTAFQDLNYCLSKNLRTKTCTFMRGIILLESGQKEAGCKDLMKAEKLEKGYAMKAIEKYCN